MMVGIKGKSGNKEFGKISNTGRTRFKKGHTPWNKGKAIRKIGKYIKRLINNKLIYEHHVVWCKDNHLYVPGGFDIHHLDRNRSNNVPENLILMQRNDHMKLHSQLNNIGGKNDKIYFRSEQRSSCN